MYHLFSSFIPIIFVSIAYIKNYAYKYHHILAIELFLNNLLRESNF